MPLDMGNTLITPMIMPLMNTFMDNHKLSISHRFALIVQNYKNIVFPPIICRFLSGKSTYSSNFFNSVVTSYKDNTVVAKSNGGNNVGFQFRSTDSFLRNLEQSNKNKDIDLSVYKEGVRVFHKKFGEGIIDVVEAEGEDLKVDINFEKVGHKRLMAKYAGLEVIGI